MRPTRTRKRWRAVPRTAGALTYAGALRGAGRRARRGRARLHARRGSRGCCSTAREAAGDGRRALARRRTTRRARPARARSGSAGRGRRGTAPTAMWRGWPARPARSTACRGAPSQSSSLTDVSPAWLQGARTTKLRPPDVVPHGPSAVATIRCAPVRANVCRKRVSLGGDGAGRGAAVRPGDGDPRRVRRRRPRSISGRPVRSGSTGTGADRRAPSRRARGRRR